MSNSGGNPSNQRSTTPMLTLGQAAKETGIDKSALSRAIKSGKLSARKMENGSFEIDPAELFRVYRPVKTVNTNEAVDMQQSTTPVQQPVPNPERELLLQQLITTVEDLRTERNRLLEVIEQQSKTVMQLTHQQQPMPDKEIRPWWSCSAWMWVLLALSLVLLAVVEWYAGYLQQIGLEY